MSRPADNTRGDLVDAAVKVFAAKGFEAGSVREIARLANANVAAVSYHFGGKEALYREVLRHSLAAFDMASFDPVSVAAMPREDAVRAFLTAQLSAMRRHSELAPYLRIFAWENLSRTAVFGDFLANERLPVLEVAAAVVDRYLGDAAAEDRNVALWWLIHQVEPFIRNPEHLSGPPLRARIDAAFVARLSETISTLVIAGLEELAGRAQSRLARAA